MARNAPSRPPGPTPVLLLLLVATLLPGVGSPSPVAAQSVEDQLAGLAAENGALYVLPFTEGLGYALTAGLFDTAHAKEPLRFDLAVRVLGALTPMDVRRFDVVLPDSVRWTHPTLGERTWIDPYRARGDDPSTPSAAGSGPGIVLEPAGAFRADLMAAGEDPDDYQVRLPEGLDLTVVPYAVGQFAVGVGLGSEVMVRFLPSFEVAGDVGTVRAVGWGLKHEVSRWVDLPFDLSVQAGAQSVEVGEYVEGSSREFGILAGRRLGPLSLYGTAGTRRSSVEVRYRAENPGGIPGLPADGTQVTFRSGLDSTLAMGAGFRLQLLLLNLSGQYLAGSYDSFSLKVGLGVP